jgi:Rrf2 family transcriptional regulator, iron-sulfur cluster assembly transcription factor
MRLEMGRRADYAIRAAIDLARHHDTGVRRKARQIAVAMDVPTTYVPQVLADLVRAELAASSAGPTGGYLLARPPAEISLLEIIRAVDDDPVSRVCVLRGGPCRWEDSCAVHVLWSEAQQAMLDRLEEATLAEVLAVDEAIEVATRPRHDQSAAPIAELGGPRLSAAATAAE